MIKFMDGLFLLETLHTSYAFSINNLSYLEHLYYGEKIIIKDDGALTQKNEFLPGNTIAYSQEHCQVTLENLKLEWSGYGKGDLREAPLEITFSDGTSTLDFIYDSHTIQKGKNAYEGLPSSYGNEDQVSTLILTLKERYHEVFVKLFYHVYESSDIISRSVVVINNEDSEITLNKLMSFQLDLDHHHYESIHFNGAWAREMSKVTQEIVSGSLIHGSISGVSSNRSNPFFMIASPHTSEDFGECYGFNLVYSGNHYSSLSVSSFYKLRIQQGIHPTNFMKVIKPKESFQSPEALMTYSNKGYNGLSHQMHYFVENHIIRGYWKKRERPILLNSWEAFYFDFNEKKLLGLAKKAKQIGVELFVLDDGWFGERNDDKRSLGDWYVNKKKLVNGLQGLCKKINDLGLDFGIWVEPEMVNDNSNLYQQHPEWAIKIPNQNHSLGRNQMILDLTNHEVRRYIINMMVDLLETCPITYVKWDMNRVFSDLYSPIKDRQQSGDFCHEYTLGLYHVLKEITEKFPKVLFESCASGGNRFDLGMLCYTPQIWASDNTDAISRLSIQEGYSYGYPISTMGAHVSHCPNHQTLRQVPFNTRFNVAAFGILGYECNLLDYNSRTLEIIKDQIDIYKKWKNVFQFGKFYRIENPMLKSGSSWMIVSPDKGAAIGGLFQKQSTPHLMDLKFYGRGLDYDQTYNFYSLPLKHSIKVFGDLINARSPIHIKDGGHLQNIMDHFYSIDGEVENYTLTGGLICKGGVFLKEAFVGLGYNENTRLFRDYDSRLYFMEKASKT